MASNREGYTEIKIGTIPAKLKLDVCVCIQLYLIPCFSWLLSVLTGSPQCLCMFYAAYTLEWAGVDSKMPLILAPLYCHFSAAIWSLAGHF